MPPAGPTGTGAGPPRSSPLEYPDDWLPTEPTEPAGDGVGLKGDGVPWPVGQGWSIGMAAF